MPAMRREGRVRGKPTNKSKLTGLPRCWFGHRRCRDRCPDHSWEKSWGKRKHRCKRFAGDVCTNPALADFRLQPARLTLLRGGNLEDHDDERWRSSVEADEGADVQIRSIIDVNSMIEAAFANFHGGYGDEVFDMDENAASPCTTLLGGGAPPLASDIAAIELAFQRQLGIFENAVEGSSFSEYATQGWSTVSEESWSDVELAESDEENVPDEDSWSIVDVNEAPE